MAEAHSPFTTENRPCRLSSGPISAADKLWFIPTEEHNLWGSYRLLLDTPAKIRDLSHQETELYWLRYLTVCTIMAGRLHQGLEKAIASRRLGRHAPSGAHHNLNPPLISDIPLEIVFPNRLPPFTTVGPPTETPHFIARHIPDMVSSEFLADGEWIGYYSYAGLHSTQQWDPMMHGIFFEILAEHPGYHAITARGEDAIGHFTLLGTIDTARGWVQMTKRYIRSGTSWEWSAIMTAFGIIGAWGGSWGGWFWLWKKAWSKRDTGVES